MNKKQYLISIKSGFIKILIGYIACISTIFIKSHISHEPFNYAILPPHIFYNITTYGILIGLMISPFLFEKFKNFK